MVSYFDKVNLRDIEIHQPPNSISLTKVFFSIKYHITTLVVIFKYPFQLPSLQPKSRMHSLELQTPYFLVHIHSQSVQKFSIFIKATSEKHMILNQN